MTRALEDLLGHGRHGVRDKAMAEKREPYQNRIELLQERWTC